MTTQLISFYTGDQYYRNKALDLKKRCHSLDIDIEISEVNNLGEYWKNTLYKPIFIHQKMLEKKKDLIWIDVDTEILYKHDSMFVWESDLYFASHTGELDGIKASPIGFKFNEICLEFLEAWKKSCKTKISSGDIDFDHDVLKYEILHQFKEKISLDIIKGELEGRDFTEGKIINNGNSRVHGKSTQTQHVLRKNSTRMSLFNGLRKEDFIYGS